MKHVIDAKLFFILKLNSTSEYYKLFDKNYKSLEWSRSRTLWTSPFVFDVILVSNGEAFDICLTCPSNQCWPYLYTHTETCSRILNGEGRGLNLFLLFILYHVIIR